MYLCTNERGMATFLNFLDGHYVAEKKTILSLCEKGAGYSLADLAGSLTV